MTRTVETPAHEPEPPTLSPTSKRAGDGAADVSTGQQNVPAVGRAAEPVGPVPAVGRAAEPAGPPGATAVGRPPAEATPFHASASAERSGPWAAGPPSSGPATPRVSDATSASLEALRAWLVPTPNGPRLLPWTLVRPQGAVEVVVVATQPGSNLRALLS